MAKPIRVLVVDDSAFNRVSIGKMLEQMPEVEIVGYAADGEAGLRKVVDLKPDLVTLDLEMPKMGGFSMLRLIMQSRPTPVIVVSARSSEGEVFKALELGAIDFVAKPSRPISSDFYSIRDDLQQKIRDFASCGPEKVQLQRVLPPKDLSRAATDVARPSVQRRVPQAVVIGASTGGPPALHQLFAGFSSAPNLSFALAQHMPPGFTRSFAERLNDHSALKVKEAVSGDSMLPGHVYVCPGGMNMALRRVQSEIRIQVLPPNPGQIYVPSVNVLFNSAAMVYGEELLGIVMTGMGNDGAEGVRAIRENGGQVLAESAESCIVYGMPKEAVATGCVNQVVSLADLRGEILRRCG